MNRFKWWAMSVFSSILVLFSLAYNFYENGIFGTQEIRILALYSPTILLSVGGVLVSVCCKGKKFKPWIESILILLNLVAWIVVGIATLIGTSSLRNFNDLVIDSSSDDFDIGEPNIYFFSFGSLYNAAFLFASWFKQYILRDDNALTTTQWTLLTLSGFLVMATGITSLDEASCNKENFYSCGRTMLSIFVGLFSGVSGTLMIPWRTAPLKCQAELALILLVTWGFAIAILTFGDGPAVYINTMYLGIFFSFFLSMNIFSTTLYADSILDASPHSQVEFGRRESQMEDDGLGAILDMAYANIARQPTDEDPNNDPRRFDESTAIMFESVGGSISSFENQLTSPRSQAASVFNKKVVIGKREFSRVEIWFWLFVESSVCLAVFHDDINKCESFVKQWIIVAPALSVLMSLVGWFTSSIKKKCAYRLEGVLIIICIILWIYGLIAVTRYHLNAESNECYDIQSETERTLTANQLFMSYGSFFTSLYLITEWSDASPTTTDWIFLTAASGTIFGVLFIGHPTVFAHCDTLRACEDLELKLVVALSLGSACLSFLMVLVSFISCCGKKLVPIAHVIIGFTLLSLWCVGSYFIVFEKEGVGSEIGPTFFACWLSLFFCVDIATNNLIMLFRSKNSDEDNDHDSVSSLFHEEPENFGDEEGNGGSKPKDINRKLVLRRATFGNGSVLSIIIDGSSSRIEYEDSEPRAPQDGLSGYSSD